jgi:hypothetical protein
MTRAGDWRDAEQIKVWALRIAEELRLESLRPNPPALIPTTVEQHAGG